MGVAPFNAERLMVMIGDGRPALASEAERAFAAGSVSRLASLLVIAVKPTAIQSGRVALEVAGAVLEPGDLRRQHRLLEPTVFLLTPVRAVSRDRSDGSASDDHGFRCQKIAAAAMVVVTGPRLNDRRLCLPPFQPSLPFRVAMADHPSDGSNRPINAGCRHPAARINGGAQGGTRCRLDGGSSRGVCRRLRRWRLGSTCVRHGRRSATIPERAIRRSRSGRRWPTPGQSRPMAPRESCTLPTSG